MNKLKILLFAEGVVFVEAFVLALLDWIYNWVFSVESDYRGITTIFIMFIVFLFYKTLTELWLFFLACIFLSRKSKLSLLDLKWAKSVSSILMMAVLVAFAIDSPGEHDIFSVYCVLYIPSVLLSYFLLKDYWEKFINWINADMNR